MELRKVKVQTSSKARPADTGARVYEMLREKAVSYNLRPGAHVNEAALAAELNVVAPLFAQL